METFSLERFRQTLDENYTWPDIYTFKFIVPEDREEEVVDIFKGENISIRRSKNGRFISITARCHIKNSAEIIAVYKKASSIEGIVAL